MTIEEYLDYQAPEGMDDELIQGVVVLSPSAFPDHADIYEQLCELLRERLRGSGFVVRQGTSMRLEKSKSMPRPDVFVMDALRWKSAKATKSYPVGSPQLAIEVSRLRTRRKNFG